MPELTLEERLAQAERENATLKDQLGLASDLSKRQAEQIETLRTGLVGVKDLPEAVRRDYQERLALGIPKEIALERALEQARHEKAMKSSEDAMYVHLRSNLQRVEDAKKAKAAASTATPAAARK